MRDTIELDNQDIKEEVNKAISNFAEKIKKIINKSKMVYNKDLQGKKEYPVRVLDLDMLLLEIDKLVEEQSSGDKK